MALDDLEVDGLLGLGLGVEDHELLVSPRRGDDLELLASKV